MKKANSNRKTSRIPIRRSKHHAMGHQAALFAGKKPLVIAVISLVAIAVLALLIVFAPTFVGKAFYIGDRNTVGMTDPGILSPSAPFLVIVKANIDTSEIDTSETTAISFELNYPGLVCTDIESLLGWHEDDGAVLTTATCDENGAVFEFATLNAELAQTGEFDIAAVSFAGIPAAGSYDIDMVSFVAIDLATSQPLALNVDGVTLTVEAPVECTPTTEVCDGLDNDCDGVIDVIENDDGTFTAVCDADNNCGEFMNLCPVNTHCILSPTNPNGASCGCDEGRASCPGGLSCTTNILTDSDNCGGCASGLIAGAETSGEVCAADQVCQAGACVDEDIDVQDDDTGSDDNGGSSGGGGGSCFSDWSCGYWSACGIDSTQTRVCEDLRNCVRTDKIETQDCVACIESWVCTSWSSCVAGKQSRQCSDENMCGSSARKPIFQKDCGSPDIGYTPAGTTPSQGEPTEPSFWSQYWLWMLLALLVILIAGGIFLYFYFWKPKEGETNISELKTWVKGAMAKGATKKKIRETIKKHGEWSNKELRHVFRSLKKEAKAAVKAAKIKVPKLK